MSYVHARERISDDTLLQIVADEHYINPYKEFDQASEVFGQYENLDIDEPPREHLRVLERVGLRGLARYMRLFGDPRDGSKLLAIKQLGLYEHSGITIWTEELGSRKGYMFDEAGWDTSHVGYVLITQARWDKVNGGDPANADEVLEAEVKEWDDTIRGNVWGYVITKLCQDAHHEDDDEDEIASCPHSDVIDSCWGFIGDPEYALKEGMAAAA